jgi:hypothetical protein
VATLQKVMVAGNGGSAADSQHLVAEFVSRLTVDRPAMRAIVLTTDTSILTALVTTTATTMYSSGRLRRWATPEMFSSASRHRKTQGIRINIFGSDFCELCICFTQLTPRWWMRT